MSFEQYDLSPDLLNGLVDTQIEKPTPLQQKVIPQALEGKHLLVKNESEDNGAFLIPALQKLIANGEVSGTRILILTPSIERAKAIDEMIWAMGYHAQVSSTSLSMKGDKVAQEQAVLDGAPVIVANPGRLVDILEKTKKTFADLECVVIDEAHNMENFSLVGRVKSIFGFIESQPQVLIFSGTMNNATKQLAENALKNPELIGFQSTDIEEKKAVEPAEINEEEIKQKLENASVKVVLNPDEKKDNKDAQETEETLIQVQDDNDEAQGNKKTEPAVIDQKEVEAKLEKASVKVVLNPEKKEIESNTGSSSDSGKAPVEKLKEASVSVVLKKDQTDEPTVPKNLEHGYINVPPRMKISTLMAHLENSTVERIVVFTASKRTADRLFRIILKKNWGVVSVDESTNKETFNERFQKFTSNEMKILIVGGMSATDIEIDKVTQVINYDVPNEVEEYRYRAELVGSKKAGQLVSLVSKMDRDDIEKITNEVGYAPEEIKLPEEVKKKKKGKSSNTKGRGKNQNKPHNKTRRSPSNNKKAKKKKETADKSYGLPRPSYDGLSGGREGDRSGGVFGWVKKLFN
ncbi:MAG TPA: hypothetical protein DCX27_17205 [Balneola sp.]|nr:hypothetical protein [Balneola sp.]